MMVWTIVADVPKSTSPPLPHGDVHSPSPAPVPADRLRALADGVFAIAMTLLVLELTVPAVAGEAGGVGKALAEMWPEFLMYALSFLVLGVYWLMHHMIYELVLRYDGTLVWLNVLYLLFAALMPFCTALIGEHGATTVTTLLYAADMLVLFVIGWTTWIYSTSRLRSEGGDIDEGLVHGARRMGLVYFAVLGTAMAIAPVSPIATLLVCAAVVGAFIGFTLAGRWEVVTVWPVRRGSVPDAPARG